MSFLYGSDNVIYAGLYLGEHVFWPVISIKDYQKSWKYVYIDDIFYTWFTKGLKQASLNEEVMFDLEFGDGKYFELYGFINILEKRIEDK